MISRMPRSLPDLKYEIELWKKSYVVIGIDEVGRGAFAGPLVVGGVIFHPGSNIQYLESLGIDDSKKLKPMQRRLLSKIIQDECLAYHVSKVSVTKINRIGITKATFVAMRDVVKNLREKCPKGILSYSEGSHVKFFVLIDKFYVKRLNGIGLKNQKGIVHGDQISLSIAAASIIAKVARDNQMRKLSAKFPLYGWGRNKGYGTSEHINALKIHGPTRLHRVIRGYSRV